MAGPVNHSGAYSIHYYTSRPYFRGSEPSPGCDELAYPHVMILIKRAHHNLLQTVFAHSGSRTQSTIGFLPRDVWTMHVRPSVTRQYSVNNAEHRLS